MNVGLDVAHPSGEHGTTESIAAPSSRSWRDLQPHHAVYLLAAVPVGLMLFQLRLASSLQWFDYWTLLPRFMNRDRSLAFRHLLDSHQGHVLGIPRLIYWTNVQLFDGSNRTLALYVVTAVIAQIVVLSSLMPRRLPPLWCASLTVLVSVLLFAPQGMHNFSRAMSGTAWLTANLLGMLAIAAASRGRTALVCVLSVLATITYGTGLMSWVAVLVIFLVLDHRQIRRLAIVCSVALVVGIWYFANYQGAGGQSRPSFEPNDVLRRTFQVLGASLVQDPEIAVAIGAIGAVVFAGLAWLTVSKGTTDNVAFVGLGVYAIGAALLIGGARGGIHSEDIGINSRYASISSMVWIAVAVLAVTVIPRAITAFSVASLGLIVFVGGQDSLSEAQAINQLQDELAVAIRMDVADNWSYYDRASTPEFLKTIGHYPFSDAFDLDCGWLNRRIDTANATVDTRGQLDSFNRTLNEKSLRVGGWYSPDDGSVDCIIIADDTGLVVGAAAYGGERLDVARSDPSRSINSGFQGVVRVGNRDTVYTAYALLEGEDKPRQLPGTLVASDSP